MTKFDPKVPISGTNGLTVENFWAWAYSDILNNANRGVFAEFLVASVLGVHDVLRIEWNEVDLRYRTKAIEVKSAAYRQSWPQARPSKIIFGIGEAFGWDAATNTYRTEAGRAADCYVFCLYKEQDETKAKEHVLDVMFWDFYVVATEQLVARFGKQKSIGLASLQKLCQPVPYQSLKTAINEVLGLPSDESLR